MIDLQDAGVRYWTFQTLTKYFLQAAAANKVEVIVLDRPNPINGIAVQGPVSTPGIEDYTTPFSEPMRPGMTLGELARMFNGEDRIGARLTVIRMTGWKRGDWYDDTGLLWINPSPNLRSLSQATAYAGTALLEGTNVNIKGPGEAPFLRFGAPWIKGTELAAYLNARAIPGVSFLPVTYVPASDKLYPFAGQRVEGVEILIHDRSAARRAGAGRGGVAALVETVRRDVPDRSRRPAAAQPHGARPDQGRQGPAHDRGGLAGRAQPLQGAARALPALLMMSTSLPFSLLDWAVILGYLALLGRGGWYFTPRHTGTAQEYFLAGGNVPAWLAAISVLSATQSAATFLGGPDFGYHGDFTYLGTNLGGLIGAIFVAQRADPALLCRARDDRLRAADPALRRARDALGRGRCS